VEVAVRLTTQLVARPADQASSSSRYHMEALDGSHGTIAVIRICIGAILTWTVIAMIGHTIEASRGNHR